MAGNLHMPTADSARDALVIWCLTDGRPGHRRQIEGLVAQLAGRRTVRDCWIDVSDPDRRQTLGHLVMGTFPAGAQLPDPQLIVGAGHTTHLPSLAARRARGGRSVILMRPTLPTALFDLCLVPEHDLLSLFGRLNRMHVVPTRGVLNPFQTSCAADRFRGLILIGGPSKHHGWSDASLLDQLRTIRRHSPPDFKWTLSTSRRTPQQFEQKLRDVLHAPGEAPAVEVVPCSATGPGWMADALNSSQTVFVTEDSISMVYEALTVGADVGLLRVPRRTQSRNATCIDRLIAERFVVSFDDWCAARFELRRREHFNEAARCAEIVCERFLPAA